jgi:hypothetical protein
MIVEVDEKDDELWELWVKHTSAVHGASTLCEGILLKELNELKSENAILKSEIEKLKDHIHTGFGGNS